VAPIAVADGVDDIAAQAHQLAVFPVQIEHDWRDAEPYLDLGLVALVVVVIGVQARGSDQRSHKNAQRTCGKRSRGCGKSIAHHRLSSFVFFG
jgi:glucose uptake protein GlcU